MDAQRYTTLSLTPEEDWLNVGEPARLVQALKRLITDLIGWGGEEVEFEFPQTD